jgi:16S rRNA (adenine1518-N6/adenine1519-N6)-dimethyltransferase
MSDLPFAKKSLGQHWLTDFFSLSAMCDAVGVTDRDTVLEIGPGLGTLTELLVERADKVVAVEFDEKLAKELPGRVPESNLSVVQQDILSFDYRTLPTDYKVVANIPYYLTSNLIRVMSESPNRPVAAALLVQKEVAVRVAAGPGDMSLLSVTAQFYWEASKGEVVPAKLFTPPPKVDSQILILKRRDTTLFPDVDPKQFFRLVKAGFTNRRKTLLNSLSGGLQLDKPATKQLLETAKINPLARPQELSLEQWHELYLHSPALAS